ncbi:MAG: helix-turn-helix domain-containing protein [Oscillospiraceae bacterium]|jgi:transcriptional regulator with XRE-family HTH domain|nr:helix-turn-helix domain-containing protein [Oscillospiraceae bacterium]
MFRRNLRLLRTMAGYTQVQMAEMIGIPTATYTRVEGGSRNLPPEIVGKLTEIFECSADDLLCGVVEIAWARGDTPNDKT